MPACYKRATIIPIRKPGSDEMRPISLLPHLSKVLEKIVLATWLSPILMKLDNSQFAFTGAAGNGTATALTLIYNTLLKDLDKSSGVSRVLMIDFSKAFDKASHWRILERLCELEVPSECVRWIQDFLTEREFNESH